MSKITCLSVNSLFLVLALFADASAATYKCIDANGDVTYSQSPCKQNQTTGKLLNSAKKAVEMEDCKYAGAFSELAFRHMRSGLSTQQLFDRYGGVNSISQGTLGVINYVYSFKYSKTMRSARVAQLTIARCNAQAFGEVACEDFPQEFQRMIFSCDDEEREEALRLQNLIDQSVRPQRQFSNSTTVDIYDSKDRDARNREWMEAQERKRKEREQLRISNCKKRYASKIEEIDARLRQGYTATSGERLRDRRRSLVRKLANDCQ